MRKFSIYTLVLVLSLFGAAMSDHTSATVLSGRIEGSCRIEAVDVCKIGFSIDVSHDETTPIIAAQVLANVEVVAEYRNDAINPFTDLGFPGRKFASESSIAARCGQAYTLKLLARATDDAEFKSIAKTRKIPCPSSVP